MDWLTWLLILAVVAVFFGLKRLGVVSRRTARQYLAEGAKVVDVRTEREYAQGHVPGAMNLPLDRLGAEADQLFPDRQQVLLVHCLSGGRSAIAKVMLRRMGYARVFNLGSLGRARKIAAESES